MVGSDQRTVVLSESGLHITQEVNVLVGPSLQCPQRTRRFALAPHLLFSLHLPDDVVNVI